MPDRVGGQVVESGSASAYGQSFVTDSAKRWVVGMWAGSFVRMRGGRNNEKISQISGNTEDTLLLDPPRPNAREDTLSSAYEVLAGASPGQTAEAVAKLESVLEETNQLLRQIRNGLGYVHTIDFVEVDEETEAECSVR